MAFVYQSERNMNNATSDVPNNVGPGTYIGHQKYQVRAAAVPFDSQVKREQNIKQDNSPGPGSYDVIKESKTLNSNAIIQQPSSEVKVLDQFKKQSMFASTTKRFQEIKPNLTPGPGAYESLTSSTKPTFYQYTSQNYIDTIMKLNKYSSIPSIPTQGQLLASNDKGINDLDLNNNPLSNGGRNSNIGPGQYQLKDAFEMNKNKGTQWHKSKVSRLNKQLPKDSTVGPGAYDPDSTLLPLYKLNPSGNFQSKSQRLFDSSKGDKSQQLKKLYFDKEKQKLMHYQGFEDIEYEQYEFQDETTPGPGHYMGNSTSNSIISTKTTQSCFGAKSKRFKEKVRMTAVGPGDYQVETNIVKQEIGVNQPAFHSANIRFESKSLEKRPGPHTYNPKITLEDKLIKKLERAPVGKFGVNQPRFDPSGNEIPGPGTYDQKLSDISKVPVSMFKSNTKRDITQNLNKNFPAPGAYEVKNYTIEQNTKIENEEDPDLAINKPAFGSSLPRFQLKQNKKINELSEDEEEDTIPMHTASKLFVKKKKEHPPFNINENRFQYEEDIDKQPGPGEYFDPKINKWEKKTFNILFQEV